jgi:hypothetical protein
LCRAKQAAFVIDLGDFHSRSMHLDIIQVFFTPTDAQIFKGVLKSTLKQFQQVSV